MKDFVKKYRALFSMGVAALTIAAALFFFEAEIKSLIAFIKSEHTHPAVVIGAFLVLPLLFFPISALLVLLGIRFGALWGCIIMFALMPIHLVISYYVVRTLFDEKLTRMAHKRGRQLFSIPEERLLMFSFLFMAIPSLPYTVKNYLLPITSIHFRDYLLVGWLAQGIMGIPFVVLGNATSQWNLGLIAVLFALLVVVYFIFRQLRKRIDRLTRPAADR
jgi:uncharacterized membrane protein YdjX (TVP38/TMEM64 family)